MVSNGYLLDLNVLIALAWPQHIHHVRVHRWFDALDMPWATTPMTEGGFVRLSTNPAVVGTRVPLAQAVDAVRSMRAAPGHRFLPDDSSLVTPVISLARVVTSRQVTDAHLLNLAAAGGHVLATLDRGVPELLEPSERWHVLLIP